MFSAISNPWRMQLKNMEFYSAPSSPKLCKSPLGHSRPNSTIDEFEFETSRRFNLDDIDLDIEDRTEKKKKNKQRTQSVDEFVPAMACKSPLGYSHPNSTIDEFEFETSSRFNLDDIDLDIEDRTEKKNKQKTQDEDEFVPMMACKSPLGYSHPNSTIDEFEFETSSRFNLDDIDFDLEERTEKKKKNKQRTQSVDEFVPAMAFADELFSDGKVLPLPPRLKIPPPPEHRSGKSSAVSSPRSPASALRIKFVHQNLWNDDFDPFLVALQSVKKDGTGKTQANNHGPRPNSNSTEQVMGLQLDQQQPNYRNGPVESPRLLVEPKGLAFARAVVNMENETGSRFDRFTVSGSILKSKQNCRDGKRFSLWKRNKLRKILSLFGKIGLKSPRSAG